MMRSMRHFKRAVIVVTALFSIPGLAAAQPALVVDNASLQEEIIHVEVAPQAEKRLKGRDDEP